ncbi:TetR family transcriptional regulator [Bacillus sp. NTK071]|uniref:TetR/AcrR family transcriptional regulator n=1 Tax=Bacillus sp. NTK071 TaxID=2802175 RepID=UPI001A901EB5|nr:TetR/AcrR family transcriptional regulator [Bacillus sp. NTK071]MBN8210585.1 TetR family transcriptional regulator [Bacillus sp. NTK071]
MPKQTFFNLNEEKKQTLIDAAKKEFSRVSLYEASISNILKTAAIPRGSFYQYFEDKEDAFFYLLNEHAKERHEHLISNLRKYDGDLFEAIEDIYHSVLTSEDAGQSNFIRNVLLNMNYKIENTFSKYLTEEALNNRYHEIYELVSTEQLNFSTEKELFHIIQILTAITFHNLIHSVSNELTIEDAMKKYQLEIELLKVGLCR